MLICVIVLSQGGDASADTESLRGPARVLRSESGAGAEVRVTRILLDASKCETLQQFLPLALFFLMCF